jgi:hypothetical protein
MRRPRLCPLTFHIKSPFLEIDVANGTRNGTALCESEIQNGRHHRQMLA